MNSMRNSKRISRINTATILTIAVFLLGWAEYPTVHEYVLETQNAKLVKATRYKIDGHSAICGRRPTVLNNSFDSWGGSYPGFIIMNPKANKSLITAVKMFIYSHECGHQFKGANELLADNFSIRRGVLYGWIRNRGDMNAICKFMRKIPADAVHPPGTIRCRKMMRYYNSLLQRRAKN